MRGSSSARPLSRYSSLLKGSAPPTLSFYNANPVSIFVGRSPRTRITAANSRQPWQTRTVFEEKQGGDKNKDEEGLEDLLEGVPDDRELSTAEVARIIQKAKEKWSSSPGLANTQVISPQEWLDKRSSGAFTEMAPPPPPPRQRTVPDERHGEGASETDMRNVDSEAVAAEARKIWAEDSEGVAKQLRPDGASHKEAAKYIGEVNDKREPHGKGVMSFADGSVKEGEWVNGSLVKGTVKVKHMSYVGDLNKEGVFHGQGKATYDDGSVYEGEWRNGTYNGRGKVKAKQGDIYEGLFKDGEPNGKGTMTYANGIVESGQWDKWLIHGTRTWPDGSSYTGDFNDLAEYHGFGKLQLVDGTLHEGEFAHDFLVRGKVKYVNGTIYEGELHQGRSHGQGMATFPNGKTYAGQWENGVFKGGVRTGKN